MQKTFTGKILTPQEFRNLFPCVRCGKMVEVRQDYLCDRCREKNLKQCQVCGIILRTEPRPVYYYDTRDRQQINFKAQTRIIKEFIYELPVFYCPHSEDLCEGCVGWEDEVLNVCKYCGGKVLNQLRLFEFDSIRLRNRFKRLSGENACNQCAYDQEAPYE